LPAALRPRKGERMRAVKWVALLLVGLLVAAGPVQTAPLPTLTITSKTGVHSFEVEIAETAAEQEKGLMFRRSMADDHGMLFDFHHEQDVNFWMQNTYIPLDMLFIKGDGRILRIEQNAEPLSTALIPSGGPVLAVLEVNGGIAHKLGIEPGDRVDYPIFKPK
jgi:uncharacterized protein